MRFVFRQSEEKFSVCMLHKDDVQMLFLIYDNRYVDFILRSGRIFCFLSRFLGHSLQTILLCATDTHKEEQKETIKNTYSSGQNKPNRANMEFIVCSKLYHLQIWNIMLCYFFIIPRIVFTTDY